MQNSENCLHKGSIIVYPAIGSFVDYTKISITH